MADEPVQKTTKKTKTRKGWRVAKKLFVVLLIIGLAVFGGFYFKKYNDLKNNPIDSSKAVEQENKRYVEAVSKLYDVPSDEQPEIYKIVDKNQLSEEIKGYGAENGDIVLLYKNAKLLIIYRPSTNKIVKATPVNIPDETAAKLQVGIIGTTDNRAKAEAVLNEKFKDKVTIIAKKDGVATYGSVVVVDVSGKNAENAKLIASALGGQVGELPAGEQAPEGTEILVIAGGQ